VHNKIGPRHKESVYQAMLAGALVAVGLSVEREHKVEIVVEDKVYGLLYIDHLVEGQVIVKRKALAHLLTNDELAQVITYLAATGFPVGLLLNLKVFEERR